MADYEPEIQHCPVAVGDHRKSANVAGDGSVKSPVSVTGFTEVRDILRKSNALQAGFKAEFAARPGGFTRPPILYLTGEAHHRQRAATARFFTPRAVDIRHRPVMVSCAERVVADLQKSGAARLDRLALDMAVTVAAEIVGLTNSDKEGMVRRLDSFFSLDMSKTGFVATTITAIRAQWGVLQFYMRDVRPAINARRKTPREDVISHLISDGYRNRDILVECLTYGAAGMVTTREFITMAAWHMLEDKDLHDRFLATDRAGRLAILEEILRLEPVVGILYRKFEGSDETLALDVRAANVDPEAVGACPFAVDPNRTRADRVAGSVLSFGDGEHRCPGAGVALAEAETLLDLLMRVPGLKLARAPDISWNPLVTGYELRNCQLVIEK
jgi:cytochrome P450